MSNTAPDLTDHLSAARIGLDATTHALARLRSAVDAEAEHVDALLAATSEPVVRDLLADYAAIKRKMREHHARHGFGDPTPEIAAAWSALCSECWPVEAKLLALANVMLESRERAAERASEAA